MGEPGRGAEGINHESLHDPSKTMVKTDAPGHTLPNSNVEVTLVKSFVAAFIALNTVCAVTVHAANNSYETRRALEFLNGRVEIHDRDDEFILKTTGWVMGAAGVAALASGFVAAGAHLNPVAYPLILASSVLAPTGIMLNVTGHLFPIWKRISIGDDGARYAKDDNIAYFFGLPIDRQYRLAQADSELRAFILQLAESYGFIYRSLGQAAHGEAARLQ